MPVVCETPKQRTMQKQSLNCLAWPWTRILISQSMQSVSQSRQGKASQVKSVWQWTRLGGKAQPSPGVFLAAVWGIRLASIPLPLDLLHHDGIVIYVTIS